MWQGQWLGAWQGDWLGPLADVTSSDGNRDGGAIDRRRKKRNERLQRELLARQMRREAEAISRERIAAIDGAVGGVVDGAIGTSGRSPAQVAQDAIDRAREAARQAAGSDDVSADGAAAVDHGAARRAENTRRAKLLAIAALMMAN